MRAGHSTSCTLLDPADQSARRWSLCSGRCFATARSGTPTSCAPSAESVARCWSSAAAWTGYLGPPPPSSELREEGGDVAREELGLLGRCEVAAARHRRPPPDVVEPLGPLARRGPLRDELVGEDGDRSRHLDELAGSECV